MVSRGAQSSAWFENPAYSPHVKKGRVLAQGTKPGTTLKDGSKVDVTVSKGKKPHHH